MGSSFFVSVAPEPIGFDLQMDGKALARNENALSARCEELGVTPVFAFLSPSAEQQRAALDMLGMHDMPVQPEQWFDPADGLRTVRALLALVPREREWFQETDLLLEDLRRVEAILLRAQAAELRWHLDADV